MTVNVTPLILLQQPTGTEIKTARQAANLTQAEVADLVGLHWQAISYAENGHRPMPLAAWALFLLVTGQHGGYALKQLKTPQTKKPPACSG